MKVEEIAEAVTRLPQDELARFRRWFAAFEAGRSDHADELDSTATKLGRFAGRALAELKRRTKDREQTVLIEPTASLAAPSSPNTASTTETTSAAQLPP